MEPEQLLFFLILIALPLLERLIRALRDRTNRPASERAGTADVERTAPRPPPRLSPREAAAESDAPRPALPLPSSPPPVLPPAVRHGDAGPHRVAGERARVRRERPHGPVTPARVGHSARPVRRSTRIQAVVAGGDLRRAVVLMAIFGPCRALEPMDASQRE